MAFDSEITHSQQREHAGGIKATVPGSLVGIPLDLGADTRLENDKRFTQKMHLSNAFVFAYRLRKIRYSRSRAAARAIEYPKGNLYQFGGPDPAPRKETTSETNPDIIYKGVQNEIGRVSVPDFDYEEDEADTRIVDGCIIVGDNSK